MYTKHKALALLSAVCLVFGLGFGCSAEPEESSPTVDTSQDEGDEEVGEADLAFNPANCTGSNDWLPSFNPLTYNPVPGPSPWANDGDPETTIGAGATNRQTPQVAKKAQDYRGKNRAFKLYHDLVEGMPVNPDANYELNPFPPFIFSPNQAYIGDNNNDPVTGLGTAFAQIGTQIDSFSHFAYNPPGNTNVNNLLYHGGLTGSQVLTPAGAQQLGVEHLKPIDAKAVLLDVKRFVNNNQMLPPGFEITLCHIMQTMDAQGMSQTNSIKEGDVVLINTGWEAMWSQPRDIYYQGGPGLAGSTPGINLEVAVWLSSRKVTAVGYDAWAGDFAAAPNFTNFHHPPAPYPPGIPFPVHHELLVKNGITQIESMHLGDLATAMWDNYDDCGDRESWMAQFSVVPEPMVGASGSAVMPIARY